MGLGGQPLAQSTGAIAPVRQLKRGLGRENAAQPGRHTPGNLLRAVSSVPCQLDLLNFGFDLHGLAESPPKVNGYMVGL